MTFDEWIEELRVSVMQGEYGYEEGEFTVHPKLWKPLFDAGLSPADAFSLALEAKAEQREERDQERRENWQRIQKADAMLKERTRHDR